MNERSLLLPDGRRASADDIARFGAGIDAIRTRERADLGEADVRYIRRLVRISRGLEVAGRALLFAGAFPPAWLVGTCLLALSKILENMEIGHNVMHGQYDFVGDPSLEGRRYEWDMASPGDGWRATHNFMHHTHTNILGKDRDVGYGAIRMCEEQEWKPVRLLQPLVAVLMGLLFEWGISGHNVPMKPFFRGEKDLRTILAELRPLLVKGARQILKDYVFFPLLAGPFFLHVLLGNVVANLVRNVWAFAVIFCGHFTEGVRMYTEEETENETPAESYVRQLLGSSNLEGGPLFHVMTGNLSHQIEHHLFPDLPSRRYAAIAVEVRALAEACHLPYNTGSFTYQFATVWLRIFRYALPSPRAAQRAETVS